MTGGCVGRRRCSRDERFALPGLQVPRIYSGIVVVADSIKRHRVDECVGAGQQVCEPVASLTMLNIELRHRLDLAAAIRNPNDATWIRRRVVDPSIRSPVALVKGIVVSELDCGSAGERGFVERSARRKNRVALDEGQRRPIRREQRSAANTWRG